MDSMDFSGKVALITGSSSGIGEEIAISFARLGANVVITGRDETKIATVVETCTKASPKKSNAFGVKCDMNNDKEVRELADMVIETFGKIDILVNNAGIGTFVPITDVNVVDTYDLIMKTNLRAPFLLTHLLATHLIKSKGSIINISSVAALHALEQGSIYCMSKAALDMLTKCLAVELGPKGVRVNSVEVSPNARNGPDSVLQLFGLQCWKRLD